MKKLLYQLIATMLAIVLVNVVQAQEKFRATSTITESVDLFKSGKISYELIGTAKKQKPNVIQDIGVDNTVGYKLTIRSSIPLSSRNVAIRDTLSKLIDISTLKIKESIDELELRIVEGNVVEFLFPTMDLPAKGATVVEFECQLITDVFQEHIIENHASIYIENEIVGRTNSVYHKIENRSKQAGFVVTDGINTNSRATIYPNPTHGSIWINQLETGYLTVRDYTGHEFLTIPIQGEQTVDLSNYPSGIYFIEITNQDGLRSVSRVVKSQ